MFVKQPNGIDVHVEKSGAGAEAIPFLHYLGGRSWRMSLTQ